MQHEVRCIPAQFFDNRGTIGICHGMKNEMDFVEKLSNLIRGQQFREFRIWDVLKTSLACWRPVMNSTGFATIDRACEVYFPFDGATTSNAQIGRPRYEVPAWNDFTSGNAASLRMIRSHSSGPIGVSH
jgi:hypothetical protein